MSRTRITGEGRSVAPSSGDRDQIASWLRVFGLTLGLPEAERRAIVDELDDHLRTRVNDLLILGREEHEAVREAIAELGETAELAGRFRRARHTARRRHIMSWTAMGMAGVAVGISAWAGLSAGTGGQAGGQIGSQVAQQPANADAVETARAGAGHYPDRPPIEFDPPIEITIGEKSYADIADLLAERAGLDVRIESTPYMGRESLRLLRERASLEIPTDTTLYVGRDGLLRADAPVAGALAEQRAEGSESFVNTEELAAEIAERRLRGTTLDQVLDQLGELFDRDGGSIELDYRVKDGRLLFDRRESFIREESEPRVYRLTGLNAPGEEPIDPGPFHVVLAKSFRTDTSGGLVDYHYMNNALYLDATPNFHEHVEAMIESLRAEVERELAEARAEVEETRRQRIARMRAELEDLRRRHNELVYESRQLPPVNFPPGGADEETKRAIRRQIAVQGKIDDVQGFMAAIRERIVEARFGSQPDTAEARERSGEGGEGLHHAPPLVRRDGQRLALFHDGLRQRIIKRPGRKGEAGGRRFAGLSGGVPRFDDDVHGKPRPGVVRPVFLQNISAVAGGRGKGDGAGLLQRLP